LIQVRVGAGGGTFVAEPNSQVVSESLTTMLRLQKTHPRELAEARMIVETNIAALAAERATAADLKLLEESIDAARQGQAAGDPNFTPYSVSFHVALARAAKNSVLLFTVNSFRSLFYEVLEKLIPDPEMAAKAIEDHHRILQAVRARDADHARDLMRAHLRYFQARASKIELPLTARLGVFRADAKPRARHSTRRNGARGKIAPKKRKR
ncbi:MAG: FadR family transcriptional regulator, partial [Chloroflexi bacterium]|nr:FadR family transcriptional regulator [Chloroflexota bacterium]